MYRDVPHLQTYLSEHAPEKGLRLEQCTYKSCGSITMLHRKTLTY